MMMKIWYFKINPSQRIRRDLCYMFMAVSKATKQKCFVQTNYMRDKKYKIYNIDCFSTMHTRAV